MSLEVVGPVYGSITLQGLPLNGRRAYGVPPGGAFDLESLHLANAMLGNPFGIEALELTMGQFTVRAISRTALAWTGAGATQAGQILETDETLTLRMPTKGCRSYLAFAGGLRSPVEIVAGSILMPKSKSLARPVTAENPTSLTPGPLRVVRGPACEILDFRRFLAAEFKASLRMDRVGVRLEPVDWLRHEVELPSEPSTPGTIQVTPGGDPIILGPDGPTIGGYPKIAFVVQSDLGRVGQLRPGDPVRLEEVSLEEARRLLRLQPRYGPPAVC